MNILQLLLQHLSLESIDDNIFRGQSTDPGWGRVFGGQVLAQALTAASHTTPHDRPVHSFHCYFIRPGNVDHPIVFNVERQRDGNTFSNRRVQAIQHGRPIFDMSASFHLHQTSYDHQISMPDVPPPEELKPTWILARENQDLLPLHLRKYFTREMPIDQRPIHFQNPFAPVVAQPRSMRWVKANGELSEDSTQHRLLLAYASDFQFLEVAMHPHGQSWTNPNLEVASLDHSMYFHRNFRFDEWLLFVVNSPTLSGARGLVEAKIFNREGDLVASAIQEGLIRFKKAAGE